MSRRIKFEMGRPLFEVEVEGGPSLMVREEFELPMTMAVDLAEKVRDFKEGMPLYAEMEFLLELEKELVGRLRATLEWGDCGLSDDLFVQARRRPGDVIDWNQDLWWLAQEVVDHKSNQELAFTIGRFSVPKGLRFTPFNLTQFLLWWMDVQEMGQEWLGLKEEVAAKAD